ncbi:MAG: glycosyltransferase family 4 protein [Gemmatimonadetes bacterium]|nr:glycosyltransferase family 4 protein [Gemmatimonadota bacterium]
MTPPLRVLIVAPTPPPLGGQAIQARRLAERLPELPGLEVALLSVNPPLGGLLGTLQRIKYVRTVVTSVAYWWSLLRTVPRYDVVHAFSASYWSFLLAPVPAMLVAKLFGKRVVLNYRSGEGDDHLGNWRSAGWGIRLADRVIAPSGYLVDVFARHGFAAQAIHNFVDTSLIRHRERTVPGTRFFANRHFEPLYNVACVVRAFAVVQRELPGAELTLAGDGSERPALERLVAELGLRNVRFAGRVPMSEMAALYDQADVYLNAPNIDNMPGSVIEAFAAGLPLASTDAGGIPYIVTDGVTGLLVPVGDHEALGRSALRLVREPGLAHRLSTAAYAESQARYVWPAVRERWVALYRELAPA